MPRYLEDLHAGDIFTSAPRTISQDEMIAFARDFDPQPFHVDPEAAKTSFFGRLAGSGWHTAALTMRLMTESDLDLAGGIIGAGMEELRWPAPLFPGDTISVRIEVLDVRPSQRRPQFGMVRFQTRTIRASDGVAVLELTGSLIVPRKVSA
jgi:acyl dehydratase